MNMLITMAKHHGKMNNFKEWVDDEIDQSNNNNDDTASKVRPTSNNGKAKNDEKKEEAPRMSQL